MDGDLAFKTGQLLHSQPPRVNVDGDRARLQLFVGVCDVDVFRIVPCTL